MCTLCSKHSKSKTKSNPKPKPNPNPTKPHLPWFASINQSLWNESCLVLHITHPVSKVSANLTYGATRALERKGEMDDFTIDRYRWMGTNNNSASCFRS
mmetsp:Transcript_18282/g.50942  ORF Transcript_18282/g.50942 Transcript_18282/m.50942 type:complete len:99 (+) Transcript_18282:600-896(+)